MLELLTPEEMGRADALAIAAGPLDGPALMRRAGMAVAELVLARFAGGRQVHVLCGPGNNGGDGYVAAAILTGSGIEVSVWRAEPPRPGSDAALAADACPVEPADIAKFRPLKDGLIVDALFGAGLARPVGDAYATAIDRANASGAPIVAVDLPSGVSGLSGQAEGPAIRADVTVTFFRRKPGHLLQPGRSRCGDTIVADIGIPAAVLAEIKPTCFENGPDIWLSAFPVPSVQTHKYARGHVGVFSGGPAATGAARLSAAGAARSGAGAVTLLSPANALAVNAMHLTSTILRKTESMEDVEAFLDERKPRALVFGPGLGTHEKVGQFALDLIAAATGKVGAIVFDADALTMLAKLRDRAFLAFREYGAPVAVLTPHEGEFKRLFPTLAEDTSLSKVEKARRAAVDARALVVLKGPDTVIAEPSGRAAINANGTPWLATAGSGDVLAGICAGLLSQGMPAFEAACAAVWLHAEAATRFGPGLIAQDLPDLLPPLLRDLLQPGSENGGGQR